MPTPTKYTYSIATDFPGTGLASDRMDQDIRDSSIVTALDRIDVAGDVCDIWFKDALSAEDKTTLTRASHSQVGTSPWMTRVLWSQPLMAATRRSGCRRCRS
jgi:hypothetical protein